MVQSPTPGSSAPPGKRLLPIVGTPGGAGGEAASVPPADVPLGFLAASGVGLVGAGSAAAILAGSLVAHPTADRSIAVVHMFMLAFLTVGVLGAIHQFAPVIGGRPLRSVALARSTVGMVVAGCWLLPLAFLLSDNRLLVVGGVLVGVGVAGVVVNLSAPLSGRAGGPSVTGLRWSLGGLVVVVAMGITYAGDRQAGERWVKLSPHVVLAHAHVGLVGWLGLSYVAVAEKLWPMFLLARRRGRGPGRFAVRLVPAGVALLAVGLFFDLRLLTAAGVVVVVAGLAAHLWSLSGLLRKSKRRHDPLVGYIVSSAVFLVAGMVLGIAALYAPVAPQVRSRLVSAEVASLAGWVGLALLGHAYKIVPFITWTALRASGHASGPTGAPLVPSDLFSDKLARPGLFAAISGFALVVGGLLSGAVPAVSAGGMLLALTGIVQLANLGVGPRLAVAGSPRRRVGQRRADPVDASDAG